MTPQEQKQNQANVKSAIDIHNKAYQAGYTTAKAEHEQEMLDVFKWLEKRKLLDELVIAINTPEDLLHEFQNRAK